MQCEYVEPRTQVQCHREADWNARMCYYHNHTWDITTRPNLSFAIERAFLPRTEVLTKAERISINNLGMKHTIPKVKKSRSPHTYYNPNDYIQLTPKELEEQGKRVLEEMKKNADPWHSQNELANRQH